MIADIISALDRKVIFYEKITVYYCGMCDVT